MRHVRNPQPGLGEVRIEDINLNFKSRDDIPALLIGIQHLYSQEAFRDRLLALMDEYILPDTDRKVGRPGMEMWRILVMGVVKQGLGCDFDRLHEPVNEHGTLRRFLGHADIRDDHRHHHQTVVDNVNLLNPELLVKVNRLIVESGHAVAGKKPGAPLRGRCDSFVVETDVRYPTDVGLLWDAMRNLLRAVGPASSDHGVTGWRQWKHLRTSVGKRFNMVRTTRKASPGHVRAYPACCAPIVDRVGETLPKLAARGAPDRTIREIRTFLTHAVRQIDRIGRRRLGGETIPHDEKVFSIFEPHTRWISKGKAGRPVEPGVPVCILEDQNGFVLHHDVMWEGGDVDHAVPMVETAQARFPELRAVSFDRGFHSPANRIRLDDLLDDNVLPGKGCLDKAERDRERGETFAAMRRRHPAVESAINNLEHRGLDRVRARGAEGFARTVALSVVALNVHRIGLLLRRKERRRYRRAA